MQISTNIGTDHTTIPANMCAFSITHQKMGIAVVIIRTILFKSNNNNSLLPFSPFCDFTLLTLLDSGQGFGWWGP